MKVELIDTLEPNINGLNKMIKCAKLFFEEFIKTKTIELAEELYDIETLSGIELGSYGTRRTIAGEHVFGTGLAEPRLTKAIIRDDNL